MSPVSHGEFFLSDFRFESGERLAQLRLHYATLGEPRRDGTGQIGNAVLLLHTTTGSAATWMEPRLAGELFGSGQPLDASRSFLVMPDAIGFGGSSKPSDGLRARFPHYRYADIVAATCRLLREGLGVSRLRLVLGLSMGGMLTWLLGAHHADFMDALVPVGCQPGPMSGRNWIQRRISIEAIRNNPEWHGGDYAANPARHAVTAPFSALMTQSVARLQERAPTREAADALYRELVERAKKIDANDRLYQLEASMDYDPSPDLARIRAPLLAINFADDELNPPILRVVEAAAERLPSMRHVLIPAGPQSSGHHSTLDARQWKAPLAEFLGSLRS